MALRTTQEVPGERDVLDARELLRQPVQVVAGKGGAGRTTLALGLALRSAQDGARTLLLEVDPPESATRMLGTYSASAHPREVENRLWVCCMTPQAALQEYALQVLKYQILYRLVFENQLVRYLLRSIPALAEFTMLGKMWWHATQDRRPDGALKYERIILDAPATGHAITFLSVARVVADVSPPGIMKSQAEQMAQMVERAVLHVVAVPEEMPVNEGLELLSAIPSRLKIRPGLAIINRVHPPVIYSGTSFWDEKLGCGPSSLAPYAWVAQRLRQRAVRERAHYERFITASARPWLMVPEVPRMKSERERIQRVALTLDQALTRGGG